MILSKKNGTHLLLSIIFVIIFTSFVLADELQVNIKGIAQGTRNRQNDYKAAVLDAKIKAIEQAGAKIESLTQIKNYQVNKKLSSQKARELFCRDIKSLTSDMWLIEPIR